MSPRLPRLTVPAILLAIVLLLGTCPSWAAPDREVIPAPERHPSQDAASPSTEYTGPREAVWHDPSHGEMIPLPNIREAVLDEDHPVAFPNPSSGVVTVQTRSPLLSVEVYDVNGRRLAFLPAHGAEAVWDGRDLSGRTVVPGVYFALVRTEGSAVRTVRIVRR